MVETSARSQAETESRRQSLRSSSIIGGASLVNVAAGILRQKAAALLLGTTGVGLIGVYQNLVQLTANTVGMGLSNVGTRQIAQAIVETDETRVAAARRAVFWFTLISATLGCLLVVVLRRPLALLLFEDAGLSGAVGWTGIAVALTVASFSQIALLTGYRHIGDVARTTVSSSLLASVVSVAAILAFGYQGIILFVLAAPAVSVLVGAIFVRRLPRSSARNVTPSAVAGQLRSMGRIGFAIMLGGMAGSVGPLAVRVILQRDLGVDALGHFQAAWAISMLYLGFILQAMGTDYFPRLAAAIKDPAAANRLVNEQTEVALLLASPALIALMGAAPWLIQLLYSSDFTEAASILRWQVLGDLLKIASWPMSYLLIAAGAGRTHVATEFTGMGVFLLMTWLALPLAGIEAPGIGFLAMYACYLPLLYFILRRSTCFRWTPQVRGLVMSLGTILIAIFLVARVNPFAGLVLAGIAAGVMGLVALKQLEDALPGRLGSLARTARATLSFLRFQKRR